MLRGLRTIVAFDPIVRIAKQSHAMRTENLKLILGVVLLSSVPTAWGGVTACPTSTGTSVGSFGATSMTNGCADVDLSFTNLSVTGGTHTVDGTTPTTSNIDIYGNGTAPSGNSIGPANLNFSGFASITGNGSETATVSAVVEANTGGSYSGGSYPTPSSPSGSWAFTDMTLLPSATFFSGDKITISETFCIGANSTNGCSSQNLGNITATYGGFGSVAFNCTFGTAGVCSNSSGNYVSFGGLSAQPTMIAISDLVTIANGNVGSVALKDIENIFGQADPDPTPEPSSLILLGSALAGLALYRFRRGTA